MKDTWKGDSSSEISSDLLGIANIGQLRRFRTKLNISHPFQAALAYYIDSWAIQAETEDDCSIMLSQYLSLDLSAVLLGSVPVIFQGSNSWSEKPYAAPKYHADKLALLLKSINNIRESNLDSRVVVLVVPEKDYILSQLLLCQGRFDGIDDAFAEFEDNLRSADVELIFKQPFKNVSDTGKINDYAYSDSHLLGRDYISIFYHVLDSIGVSNNELAKRVHLKRRLVFNDLAAKFYPKRQSMTEELCPEYYGESCSLVAGYDDFSSPLGNTWQEYVNSNPVSSQSLLLLGDSHSSIYSQHKLNFLFANTFKHTRFAWNPCGIRQQVGSADYDIIVLEISLRFCI